MILRPHRNGESHAADDSHLNRSSFRCAAHFHDRRQSFGAGGGQAESSAEPAVRCVSRHGDVSQGCAASAAARRRRADRSAAMQESDEDRILNQKLKSICRGC